MGNKHGSIIEKVCIGINDFIDAPDNQKLPFRTVVYVIKQLIVNAELKYGESTITKSMWILDTKNEVLAATWTDFNKDLIVIIDWKAAEGKRGGCQIGDPPPQQSQDAILFYSQHFRDNYDRSINIDGVLTFTPNDISCECHQTRVGSPVIFPTPPESPGGITPPQPPKPPGGITPPQPPKPLGGITPPQPPKPPGGITPPQPPKPPGGITPPQPPKPPVDESTCQIIICGNCRHSKCSCHRYRSCSSRRSRKRH